MKKAKKPSHLTFYLVSAEDNGVQYWKFGITKHDNPLKRDPKRYQEVFRAVPLDYLDATQAEQDFRDVVRLFLGGCPVGRESLDYKASLESILALFDWLVWRAVVRPGNPFRTECWISHRNYIINNEDVACAAQLAPLVRAVGRSIEECCQSVKALEPMWA
ncbi:MAG: hypothetical protein EBZ26_09265 [Flavobacteriia bacterium]|nr:hypothetical protein [Flavobacteriia bacterium]